MVLIFFTANGYYFFLSHFHAERLTFLDVSRLTVNPIETLSQQSQQQLYSTNQCLIQYLTLNQQGSKLATKWSHMRLNFNFGCGHKNHV